MDHVEPGELVPLCIDVGEKKAKHSWATMLIKAFMAGAFLAYATTLALVPVAQGLPPLVGALLFPAGFVMVVLLGMELATGNFALLPNCVAARRIGYRELLRNWTWVYIGNLIGSVFYALLFYIAITEAGAVEPGALGKSTVLLAEKKVLSYEAAGLHGWFTAFVKGILCNWMVTLGTVMGFISRSTIGKIAAMWLPIMTFFALGYEHSVVNMFVIPGGMLFGADISIGQWWLWNQIPVTLGNIVGGALFTGLALYALYGRAPAVQPRG